MEIHRNSSVDFEPCPVRPAMAQYSYSARHLPSPEMCQFYKAQIVYKENIVSEKDYDEKSYSNTHLHSWQEDLRLLPPPPARAAASRTFWLTEDNSNLKKNSAFFHKYNYKTSSSTQEKNGAKIGKALFRAIAPTFFFDFYGTEARIILHCLMTQIFKDQFRVRIDL